MLFLHLVIMLACSVLFPSSPKSSSSGLVSSYTVITTTDYEGFGDVRSDFEILPYRTTKR